MKINKEWIILITSYLLIIGFVYWIISDKGIPCTENWCRDSSSQVNFDGTW